MNKKFKIGVFDLIWLLFAGVAFGLRYVKIISVDFGIFGSTYITFIQKINNCSLPIINTLKTCQNITITNIIWWAVIGMLVVVQLIVLANRLKN